jgi:hypothetical protein
MATTRLRQTTELLRRAALRLARPRAPVPRPHTLELPTQEQEEALLDRLILGGWEQGCWLDEHIATAALDAAGQRALFHAVADRVPLHREEALAAAGHHVPEMLPRYDAGPPDTCWVVLTQRCDLIKGLRQEPTVALARVMRWEAPDARSHTRRSLCLIRDEGLTAWVADLRESIVVPKTALGAYDARQCLSDAPKVRRRFAFDSPTASGAVRYLPRSSA